MTVLEVLQSSTAYFEKHRVEKPRLNAEHLLAHVLGRKRIDLYIEFERDLAETELEPLRQLVKRRGVGEPLQHLLGTVEFCGQTFLCDKRAMVPRPETEQLVELLVSNFSSAIGPRRSGAAERSEIRIVDVGTGSGVIALSLAAKIPEAKVVGVDISEDALSLAGENAVRLGLGERVQFKKGNLLENFAERFDLIVANLPYIAMKDRDTLSREVLHDPAESLFGGDRGDELIRELIEQAVSQLAPNGLLALEIGTDQAQGLAELLTEKNFHDIETKSDYSGIPRFLFARYG